jgi:hypothetical protein
MHFLSTLSMAEITYRQWKMTQYGASVEWHWRGKSEVLREKPVLVPIRPPQNPTRTDLGSKAGLRGERQTTNHLNKHGSHWSLYEFTGYRNVTLKGYTKIKIHSYKLHTEQSLNKQFFWNDNVPLDETVRTFRKKQCRKVNQSKNSRYGTNPMYLKTKALVPSKSRAPIA